MIQHSCVSSLRRCWVSLVLVLLIVAATNLGGAAVVDEAKLPRRILMDTDVDTDDFFALLYLLKLNRSQFQLEVSNY